MKNRLLALAAVTAGAVFGQSQTVPGPSTVTPDAYVPGTTYQANNPNYMTRAPFYFEGRVDWNLLKITTPSGPWEFTQRGIHYQDDLEDQTNAIADFRTAVSLNSLTNGTCQILSTAVTTASVVNPPPCMFTPRLRLAHLIKGTDPTGAMALFQEVLQIDPLRLGVNGYIAEVYEAMANNSADEASKTSFLNKAVASFKAELLLSPVDANYTAISGDKANNAHVHWSLSEIYAELGDSVNEAKELQSYLDATQWHSDTYAWHIQLAKIRLAKLGSRHLPAAIAR